MHRMLLSHRFCIACPCAATTISRQWPHVESGGRHFRRRYSRRPYRCAGPASTDKRQRSVVWHRVHCPRRVFTVRVQRWGLALCAPDEPTVTSQPTSDNPQIVARRASALYVKMHRFPCTQCPMQRKSPGGLPTSPPTAPSTRPQFWTRLVGASAVAHWCSMS